MTFNFNNPSKPTQPAQQKPAFSFGNVGNKFSGFGTTFSNQNQPLIDENKKLSELASNTNDKDKDAINNGLTIICDLWNIAEQYEKQAQSKIEGAESFEKDLTQLRENINRSIKHSLKTLANEIDHGNAFISEQQRQKTTNERTYESSRNNHELPSPFLVNYAESLKNRGESITQAIRSFEENLDHTNSHASSAQDPQTLITVLNQQYEAIIRCSARIAQIQEKSENIHKRMQNLKGSSLSIMNQEQDSEKSSYAKKLTKAYDDFQTKRLNDLEKRNNTDREQFRPKTQTTGAFNFGYGSKTNQFGSFGKSNIGTGGGTATNFGTFGSTNKSATTTTTLK